MCGQLDTHQVQEFTVVFIAVPEAPSSVQVVGNIVFLWQPPSKPNGVITGYQIVISYNDSLTGQVVMETPIPLSRDTFVYDLRTVSLPENVTATITVSACLAFNSLHVH